MSLFVPHLFAVVKLKLHLDSFPLFSKGVDTYRFEYGVFLLNKDIELVGTTSLRAHAASR